MDFNVIHPIGLLLNTTNTAASPLGRGAERMRGGEGSRRQKPANDIGIPKEMLLEIVRQNAPNYPLSHASRASSPRGRACCCLYLSINRGTLWQAKDHFFAYLLSTSLPSPAAHPPARSLAMALSLRAARLCATCIFRAFTNGRCCSCARMPPRRCSSFAESSISR